MVEMQLGEIKDIGFRREHGDISALKKSIQEVGLINPLTINQDGRLLAGRRRFQALAELGWKKVPIRIIKSEGELFDFRVALIENIQRKNLSDPEEAAAIAEYDELKRKMEGESKGGTRTDLGYSMAEVKGWTQDKTASDLGISRQAVTKAIQIAEAIEENPERIKLKTGTAILRNVRHEEVRKKVSELPTSKYRVIYADPPWNYSDKCEDGAIQSGGAESHYSTMTISELCAMNIKNIVEENAVLFLWVTSPFLSDCWPIIKSWGFEYKASFVWDKIRHNMGHYNSVRHEFLLICTRDSCLPEIKTLYDSVVSIERTKHSEKPKYFRNLIDKMYPTGKRIELFAREKVEGWDSWGNEINGRLL